jgi:hypothetical protein
VSAERGTVVHGKNAAGEPIFSVLLKRTYSVRPGGRCVRAEKDRLLLQTDQYYDGGDPASSTVQYEGDLSPYKVATDLVVVGKAVAAGGKATPQMDVAVEVAGKTKTIRVIGDRACSFQEGKAPRFGEPTPFKEMEVRYDRAYGGRDVKSVPNLPFYYPRNHMGRGVVLKNTREVVDGLPLPNLEDPQDLLTPERVVLGEPERWNRQPIPQGFGWFQKTWYPRCSFAGAFPGFVPPGETMREETLGLVPKNQMDLARQFKLPSFDARFLSGASPGLAFPYFSGNEWIRISGMRAEGEVRLQLAGETPRLALDIGHGAPDLEAVLQTVCVRLDDMEVDLTWRGARGYPGIEWLPEMKKLEASVAG